MKKQKKVKMNTETENFECKNFGSGLYIEDKPPIRYPNDWTFDRAVIFSND